MLKSIFYSTVRMAAALLTTDQRGAPRPVGVRCDVGAFEYSPLRYLYLPLVPRQVYAPCWNGSTT